MRFSSLVGKRGFDLRQPLMANSQRMLQEHANVVERLDKSFGNNWLLSLQWASAAHAVGPCNAMDLFALDVCGP